MIRYTMCTIPNRIISSQIKSHLISSQPINYHLNQFLPDQFPLKSTFYRIKSSPNQVPSKRFPPKSIPSNQFLSHPINSHSSCSSLLQGIIFKQVSLLHEASLLNEYPLFLHVTFKRVVTFKQIKNLSI